MKIMFNETIRKYGFWFVDALGGGHIRKNLLNLERKFQDEEDTCEEDVRKILNHAVNTTTFYKNFEGHSGIKDFPVIKKSMIIEKSDQFISSEYRSRRLHKMHTSGSTGKHFTILQDRQKRKKVIAELIYFHKQCGFNLGCRYVYVRVWDRKNQKSKMVQLAENLIMFDCSSLSDESLHQLYKILKKDSSIKCVIGYANALLAIASYFDRQGYTPDMFSLKIIVSTSERLEAGAKALLKKVFGCAVVSRYSNQENGVLGQQSVYNDKFILNTAHYFFETLQIDANEPASCGEPARLVLTDLYNYAMPLIRYDTEDVVVMDEPDLSGLSKKFLTDVSGRCDEIIYDTHGNKIHHQFLALNLDRYDRLSKFQFIQNDLKIFTLKLEKAQGLYDDSDILNTVSELVGSDAVIKIEHVDNIPHLSSGKFKKFICNYNANPE